METENLIPSENIKQELDDCETAVCSGVPQHAGRYSPTSEEVGDFDSTFSDQFVRMKQEQDFGSQKVKKEADDIEEGDVLSNKTSSTNLYYSDEDNFLYCSKCQMKYREGCPIHGPLIYVDNAETSDDEDCSLDSGTKIEISDNKNGQWPGRTMLMKFGIHEADHDDEETLPNEDCKTESAQIFSRCETNTELFVPGASHIFQSNVNIKTHQKTHSATKEKRFACDMCGAGFTYRCHLNRHKRTHTGERPHKCDMCGIAFTDIGNLAAHKRTHTGEKRYKCDVCGVGCIRSGDLRRHMRTHTGEKPYKCDLCSVGFIESGSLKRHLRIHAGEKSYKCDVCGGGFVESCALKAHMRTHTGEKPYKCDACGAGFSVNGALKRHKRIHTGEKPYKCDVCGAGFSVSSHLKAHQKIHLKNTL